MPLPALPQKMGSLLSEKSIEKTVESSKKRTVSTKNKKSKAETVAVEVQPELTQESLSTSLPSKSIEEPKRNKGYRQKNLRARYQCAHARSGIAFSV